VALEPETQAVGAPFSTTKTGAWACPVTYPWVVVRDACQVEAYPTPA
jgi:hypothetical protein